jgi:CubicO group peptidase (beta-lactamase class C family)
MGNSATQEAVGRLAAAVEQDIRRGLYHGAVLDLRISGEPVWTAALGETDKAKGRRAQPDDLFLAMSVSKAFVAVTVLQAIDRGELELDTRVADLIPEFAAKGKQRATILHLLTHQAGTFSGFMTPPPLEWAVDAGNIAKCVAVLSAMPAAHAPGERVIYNPWASYAVLAEIVARLDRTKRHFQDIVREDVFLPLGMAETRYGCPLDEPRRVPVAVAEPGTSPQERAAMEALNRIIDARCIIPAGGAFTTLADAVRFIEMLRRGGSLDGVRILSPSLVRYALLNHTGDKHNGFWDYSREERGIDPFPARITLLGGYTRGEGHYISAMGLTASPGSYATVGGGSTMLMFDPERRLSFTFLSAGFLEGLNHFRRLQKLSDLALAAAP